MNPTTSDRNAQFIRDERPHYYFQVQNEVIDDRAADIGVYGLAVYSVILRCAAGKQTCYPSQSYIAKKLGIARETVNTAFDRLRGAGFIATQQQTGPNGERLSDLITLLDTRRPPVTQTDTPVTQTDTPLLANSHPPTSKLTPPCLAESHKVNKTEVNKGSKRTSSYPPSSDATQNTSSSPDSSTEASSPEQATGKRAQGVNAREDVMLAQFERWYAAYPRHESKQAAWKAWAKIDPSMTDALIAAVAVQAIEKGWHDPARRQYVPLPATWLNGKRWEDELPSVSLNSNSHPLKEITAQSVYSEETGVTEDKLSARDDAAEQFTALDFIAQSSPSLEDYRGLIRFTQNRMRWREVLPSEIQSVRSSWNAAGRPLS